MPEISGTEPDRRARERISPESHIKYLADKIKSLREQMTKGEIAPEEFDRKIALWIDKLEQERVRDPLTGVLNRAGFGFLVDHELEVSTLTPGKSLGYVFLDLDKFKDVNDTEPDRHSAGDRTLIEFARILDEIVPAPAIIARLGGEEFAFMVQNINPDELRDLVNAVGQKVAKDLAKAADLQRPKVTVSVGACFAEAGDTASSLMRRADLYLYKAKEGGRNRMVLQNPQGQEKTVEFSA